VACTQVADAKSTTVTAIARRSTRGVSRNRQNRLIATTTAPLAAPVAASRASIATGVARVRRRLVIA